MQILGRKTKAGLSLGVSLAAFSELERAEIKTDFLRITDMDTLRIIGRDTAALPGERRYRFSVRPSVEIRPASWLEISNHTYFKLPLDNPTRDVRRQFDYRVDSESCVKLTLKEDSDGNKKAALKLVYEYRYDNAPPVADRIVSTSSTGTTVLRKHEASDRHTIVTLSFEVAL